MKQFIQNLVETIAIFVGILIVIYTIANFIGQAFKYGDLEKKQKMEMCIQHIDYNECYVAIYWYGNYHEVNKK